MISLKLSFCLGSLPSLPGPLGACGTQGTVEEELGTRIPHQAIPLQGKSVVILNDSTGFRLLGKGTSNTTLSCAQQDIIFDIIYDHLGT
jgi:hypothetical protein